MELREVTKVLPTQQLRERYSDLTHRLTGEKPVTSSQVRDFYTNLERQNETDPDPAALEAIEFHRSFYDINLNPQDLARIECYSDLSPNHPSYYLTDGGKDKSLLHVAKRFIENDVPNNMEPWKLENVRDMIKQLKAGQSFPAIILSERPKGMRPDGKIHVIDGVHRLLALAVHQLQNPDSSMSQSAYIA